MQTHKKFSMKRVDALIIHDIRVNLPVILIALLASLVVLLMVSALAASAKSRLEFHHMISFPFTLLVGGILLTSTSFSDYNNARRGPIVLTLPASPLEKLLARFVITLPGYILLIAPFYALFLLLSRLINASLFEHVHPLISFSSGYYPRMLAVFTVIHAVFFLGSLYFKRQSFIRTLLAVSLAFALIYFMQSLSLHLVFYNTGIIRPNLLKPLLAHVLTQKSVMSAVGLFIVLVCWTASILRIREIEA